MRISDCGLIRRKAAANRQQTASRGNTLCCLLLFTAYCLLPTAYCLSKSEIQVTVRVKAESVAEGERLTLGDVAEIDSADSGVAERLRAVSLGYAPKVGAVRELTREKIQLAIAAAGFSADEVTLQSPAVAIVKRASQRVSPDLLREAVERVTLSELQAAGARAQLVRLDLPPSILLPSGAVEARASTGGVKDYFAPFPVTIDLLVDAHVVRRLSVTAQVEVEAPVLVAAHDLAEHTRVREEDVRVETRKLERPVSLYVRDKERLRGSSVARAVSSGEEIMTDALYADVVVRPGDTVHIVLDSGVLNLNVLGEARAAGRVGDRIQVKNLQSGVLLQATVVDEGLVRVKF